MARTPSTIESVRPWFFQGMEGQVVETRHLTIYTTERSALIAERMPVFLEAAVKNYTRGGGVMNLPEPSHKLAVYVMNDREHWRTLTMQLLGERGAAVTQISRGGFTTDGRSLLFDIGSTDTMTIAAHECWHAYTQTTFPRAMPMWLEEGLATFMEGHRWTGRQPEFMPWANLVRFDKLREATNKKLLRPLTEVLANSPNEMLTGGTSDDVAVVWYSQVWALTHFLNEGEGGRYRAGLQRCISDAATGSIGKSSRSVQPIDIFREYIDSDLDRLNVEYERFVRKLVSLGGREAVNSGRSPVASMP